MYYYKVFDLKVKSDLKFSQLILCDDEKQCDLEIVSGEMPQDILEKSEEKKYEFGTDRSYLSNRTCWMLVEHGNRITYTLKQGGLEKYLQSYLLGFGMAMIAMQRGMIAIHCSALADEDGAVLIAGESGAGKSTLATAFIEAGYRFMADDMVLVETVEGKAMAKPAFPFQKLCRNVVMEKGYDMNEVIYINEEKDKFLVPFKGEFVKEPLPVKAFIYLVIVDGEEVLTEEVKGIGKLSLCANNLFLRNLLGSRKFAPHIGQKCLEAAAAMPMYCVGRPDKKDTSKEVSEKVFEFLSTLV